MKIGITTFGGDAGRSGIGQYIVRLLAELACAPTAHEFEVLVLERERDVFARDSARLRQRGVPDWLGHPVINLMWHQGSLGRLCRARGYDALLLAAANRRVPFWVPCPTVGVVHDLASMHLTNKYDAARQFYIRNIVPRLVRRLDQVITVSACTQRDVIEYTGLPPSRVHVIPLAADPQMFYPRDHRDALSRVRTRYGFDGPFVLYVARIEHPGKNHVRLIRAFARLKRRLPTLPHRLVLGGRDCERADEVHAEARACGLDKDIVFPGFVGADELPDLYSAADLFVMPSLFEGFGLPVLEAMACGVPVACSGVSSLPEVAGDAAMLFDPEDETSISDAMEVLLTDEGRRGELRARGLRRGSEFSWSRTARHTLDVLERTAREGVELRAHRVAGSIS